MHVIDVRPECEADLPRILEIRGGPHDPILQVLEIGAGVLSSMRGHIEFHPAFADLETE